MIPERYIEEIEDNYGLLIIREEDTGIDYDEEEGVEEDIYEVLIIREEETDYDEEEGEE
jgi:hypothetical protein